MEFISRESEEREKRDEEILEAARTNSDRLLDLAPDEILDTTERLWDAHDARCYKYAAEAAMTKMSQKNNHKFKETFERYMENNRRLRELREGEPEEKPEFQLDYGKVAYTGITQLSNVALAILCITIGAWPAVFCTVPALFLLNFYWLVKDQQDG